MAKRKSSDEALPNKAFTQGNRPRNPNPIVLTQPENTNSLHYQVYKLQKSTVRQRIKLDNTEQEKEVFKKTTGLSVVSDAPNADSEDQNLFFHGMKLLIFIAMYNEEPKELKDTLDGILENIDDFDDEGRSYRVSKDEIGVVVVVDGYYPFTKGMDGVKREFYSNFYDESKINLVYDEREAHRDRVAQEKQKESFNIDDEHAHCFFKKYYNPEVSDNYLKLAFCIKEKNKRKLNSQLWFFGGFCVNFRADYCILLDVGTKPLKKSLYYLYRAMEKDPDVAGCCGEIKPSFDTHSPYCNPIFMAQVVEYKISHVFDKALESLIGFITVLPGAFSAYRWSQLEDKDGEILWNDYFKSVCRTWEMDCFNSNIYLAEDRVMCHSLVCKNKNILRFVKNSVSETDVPDTLPKLLMQRRRWINGSWFALIHVMKHCDGLFKGDHSIFRKIGFFFMMIYYLLNIMFSWVMVGSFFVVFAITAKNVLEYDESGAGWDPGNILVNVYVGLIMCMVIISLSTRPNRVELFIKLLSGFFAVYMIIAIVLMGVYLAGISTDDKELNDKEKRERDLTVFIGVGTVVCFTILLIVYKSQSWAALDVLKGSIHFIAMTPTYVNIFLIYAICNIHDCTWGTRPDDMKEEERKKKEEFEAFRAKWVLVWLLCNVAFGYNLNAIDNEDNSGDGDNFIFIYIIALIGMGILIIRFIGGMLYLLQEFCRSCTKKKRTDDNSHEKLSDTGGKSPNNAV